MSDQNNNKTLKIKSILTSNEERNLSQDSVEIDGCAIPTQAPRDSLDEDILSTNYSEERKSESTEGHGMPSACD